MNDLAFLDLLPASESAAVHNVRLIISPKYQRGKRLDHFKECLFILLSFVDQHKDDHWKRALLCGVCACNDLLAVNNARPQMFAHRSKSSINDLFAKLGYRTVSINQKNQALVISKIPFLQAHNHELRQWTYRVRDDSPLGIQTDPASACVEAPICNAVSAVADASPARDNAAENAPSTGTCDDSFGWDDWTSCTGDCFFTF
jgi:hypothetical protein